MLVKCDGPESCGRVFHLEKFELAKLDNEVEKTYFTCPHCGKEYVAFYTDPTIRKKQEKIRKLYSPYKIEKLKNEIAEDMKKLRSEIEASTM